MSEDPQAQLDKAYANYAAQVPFYAEERLRVVGGVLEVVHVSGPVSDRTGQISVRDTKVIARYRLEKLS